MDRRRLIISALVGVVAGPLCWAYQETWHRNGGDVWYSVRLFIDYIAGRDPYAYTDTPSAYPLTAALAVAPLALFSPNVAAGVFIGLSSALLAWALTRDHLWWRLTVFLSFPYWAALQVAQWSPLLLAVAFMPALLPLTLCKPHIGLPIALTRLTWRRALLCAGFGAVSLLVQPDWPLRFLGHQNAPEQYLPILLTFPLGPLLLLALIRWRDPQSQYLLLLSAVPQRAFYDVLVLWLIVLNTNSPRALLVFTALSWLVHIGWYYSIAAASTLIIGLLYVPALTLVLWPVFTPRADRSSMADAVTIDDDRV